MQVEHLLNSKIPFLLDGGLSNVLESIGCDLNHKLWTAHLLEENPNAIIQAHLDYLKAGAQCITTSSYQASFLGLTSLGYSKDKAEKLIVKSIELAEIAIKKALELGIIDDTPLIAASVGPYGAYLADGSEYRGNYGVTDETLIGFHLERIQILDRTHANVLACETIPSFQEAKVLSEILLQVNKPAWISFSCKDEHHLNDGSKIVDGVALFKDHPKVFAIGVNCTNPKYISSIIKHIKNTGPEKKIIVYPNSGEAYNAETKTWLGLSDPDSFVSMTKEWVKMGADIIGGCCRIGPRHIKSMSRVLLKNGIE
ncbi:MAG: homocysteine S-methyltransferase [Bacteroidota bacterium]